MNLATDPADSARPCVIQTRPWSPQDRWNINCSTHRCEARSSFPDEASARAAFCCDRGARGARWWFIVHHLDDDPPPELVDLTGLAQAVRAYIQNDVLSERGLLVVWRYLGGECRAVDVDISSVGTNEWLVHISDEPGDAQGVGRTPDTYLTFHHVLE